MSSTGISLFLALLPISVVIVLALWRGMQLAGGIGFALATVLFFVWGNPLRQFFATLGSSTVVTVDILMIVFGALFLYGVMRESGLIRRISHSFDTLYPSKDIKFFLLAIAMTSLLEGVAGFGTPGALVPVLLVALGFGAVLSISTVLLIDGIVVAFGAVGTPILRGLGETLSLSPGVESQISHLTGWLIIAASLVTAWFIVRLYEQSEGPLRHRREVMIIFLSFIIPFAILSQVIPALASILAPLIMIALTTLFLRRHRGHVNIRPWTPYIILSVILILPNLWPVLHQALSTAIGSPHLFGTDIAVAFKPLRSPLMPFFLVALGVILTTKRPWRPALRLSATKTWSALLVLWPIITIAQLMVHSGATQPSMVTTIAEAFSKMGSGFFTAMVPAMGILGSFVTGSNTVSNIVFGPTHLAVAKELGLSIVPILALQTVGGALGNAINLFNIIAAGMVVHLTDTHHILRRNLVPTLAAGALITLLGGLMYLFYQVK